MNNTFFESISDYIICKGDVLTKDEYVEASEQIDQIGNKFDEEGKSTIESIDITKYYFTASPHSVIAERSALVEFYRTEGEDPVFIPEYMVEKPQILNQLYDAVVVDGKVYAKSHSDIVYTEDTNNYIFEDNAYLVANHGYFENCDKLIKLEDDNEEWAFEDDVVVTEDFGNKCLKQRCYRYKDQNGNVEYYQYSQLAPDAREEVIRFQEATFPEQDEINESRIGIELEYSSAIAATRQALLSRKFRDKFISVRDGSIPNQGTEFVSTPLKLEELDIVPEFMAFVERHGAKINRDCGFHVHIGSPNLDFKSLTSVIVLCDNIEDDLFKLMPSYRQDNRFCKKMDKSFDGFRKQKDNEEEVANMFYDGTATYKSRKTQSKWAVDSKRHFWVNVDRFWRYKDEPHKRTIEYRLHHATHNSGDFMQFILLCYYITKFGINNTSKTCENSNLNDILDSITNYRHKEKVQTLLSSKKVIQ